MKAILILLALLSTQAMSTSLVNVEQASKQASKQSTSKSSIKENLIVQIERRPNRVSRMGRETREARTVRSVRNVEIKKYVKISKNNHYYYNF